VTTSMNRLNLLRKRAVKGRPKTASDCGAQTQLQLDVVSKPKSTCQTCGMEYLPMVIEDARLHDKFHDQCLHGQPIVLGPKSVVVRHLDLQANEGLMSRISKDCKIVRIDGMSRLAERTVVEELLDTANRELGAPTGNDSWRQAGKGAAFVFVVDSRAIGFVSVERVTHGSYVDLSTGQLRPGRVPATMGISRLYVSKRFRGRGVALELVQTAAATFVYGSDVPPCRVAWTQPSTTGTRVALRFCPNPDGIVLVYDERFLHR
jgi:N-acetyltransferase